MLEKAVFHGRVHLGNTVAHAEIANGSRGVAAAAQAADGGHSRVVPAADITAFDECAQLAFAHDRVVDAEAGELDLTRLCGQRDVVDNPIVQRAVILKFERTQRVRDVLHGVLDGVREVVHRVDAPFGTGAMVRHVVDAVDDRVAHIEVAGSEVNLCTERHSAVFKLAGAHAGKQVETLLHRTVTVRALRRGGEVAAHFTHLVRRELANIGKALFDELYGAVVHIFKIIGSIVEAVFPIVAEPVDIFLDGIDVLHVFLCGVRVVHAQVTDAVKALCGAEIDVDRLGVADVQVAVRLRRETGVHLHAFAAAALCEVFYNKIIDKTAADLLGDRFVFDLFTHNLSIPFLISGFSSCFMRSRSFEGRAVNGAAPPLCRARREFP